MKVLVIAMMVVSVWARQDNDDEVNLDAAETSLLERTLLDLRRDLMLETRAIRCMPGETACDIKGRAGCISMAKRCDGNKDCPNNSDEAYCNLLCGQLYGQMSQNEWEKGYYCEADRKCISQIERCDGKRQCPKDPLEETEALGCPKQKRSSLRSLLEEYLANED